MHAPVSPRRSHPADARFSDWAAADGWRLRRMDLPAAGAARGRMLLAGGRGDFIEKNIEAALHWQARGWALTAFDWRGQGGSAGTIRRGHLTSMDPLVADGAALIDDWRGEGPGPHVAVGHSMGGHLLLRILAEHRPPLDAAVLVAPMVAVNTRPLGPRAARLLAAAMIAAGQAERPLPASSPATRRANLTGCAERFDDEAWWKAQAPAYDLGPPTWGWIAAALASSARLDAAALAGVAVPCLLIGTDRDRLVDPAAIRAAAARLPDAELVMLPDAAHELLRERDPVRLETLSRIDDFLDRRAAR